MCTPIIFLCFVARNGETQVEAESSWMNVNVQRAILGIKYHMLRFNNVEQICLYWIRCLRLLLNLNFVGTSSLTYIQDLFNLIFSHCIFSFLFSIFPFCFCFCFFFWARKKKVFIFQSGSCEPIFWRFCLLKEHDVFMLAHFLEPFCTI